MIFRNYLVRYKKCTRCLYLQLLSDDSDDERYEEMKDMKESF